MTHLHSLPQHPEQSPISLDDNICNRALFHSILNALPSTSSAVFPFCCLSFIGNQNKPWHEGRQFVFSTLLQTISICLLCCQAQTLTYMFTALKVHIWCAILLLLLKDATLATNFLFFFLQAVNKTNQGKTSFLLNRNSVCIIALMLSELS